MAREIKGKVLVCVKKNCMEKEALFDTGATRSAVSEEFAKDLGYEKYDEPQIILLATNKTAEVVGRVPDAILSVADCELPLSYTLAVVRDLRKDLVIGMDVMESNGIKVDSREGRVYLEKCPPEIRL